MYARRHVWPRYGWERGKPRRSSSCRTKFRQPLPRISLMGHVPVDSILDHFSMSILCKMVYIDRLHGHTFTTYRPKRSLQTCRLITLISGTESVTGSQAWMSGVLSSVLPVGGCQVVLCVYFCPRGKLKVSHRYIVANGNSHNHLTNRERTPMSEVTCPYRPGSQERDGR